MLLRFCLYIFLCCRMLRAQSVSDELSARSLDALLQEYAFRAMVRPRTGIPYEADVAGNLTGIKVAGMRLRSGSLRRRGVSSYKEFQIPAGVIGQPYVERLVLVYHDLANWTSSFYPLPGHTFLGPVLGLLAYDGSDLSAQNLPELDIRASEKPISIQFQSLKAVAVGYSPKCVFFNIDGSHEFDNVVNQTTCHTTKQGHCAIVAELPPPGGGGRTGGGAGGKNGRRNMWIIIGSTVGGIVIIVFAGILFGCVRKCVRKRRRKRMEEESEREVPLPMTRVGYTKAPVAMETRTRPLLEDEYLS